MALSPLAGVGRYLGLQKVAQNGLIAALAVIGELITGFINKWRAQKKRYGRNFW